MEARTITVEGLRTRVVVQDGGAGRDPIVLIHGVGGWAETWRPVGVVTCSVAPTASLWLSANLWSTTVCPGRRLASVAGAFGAVLGYGAVLLYLHKKP